MRTRFKRNPLQNSREGKLGRRNRNRDLSVEAKKQDGNVAGGKHVSAFQLHLRN